MPAAAGWFKHVPGEIILNLLDQNLPGRRLLRRVALPPFCSPQYRALVGASAAATTLVVCLCSNLHCVDRLWPGRLLSKVAQPAQTPPVAASDQSALPARARDHHAATLVVSAWRHDRVAASARFHRAVQLRSASPRSRGPSRGRRSALLRLLPAR